MKRFIYALMMVLACELACSVIPSAAPAFEAQAASKGAMVYYVVVGSFSSYSHAVAFDDFIRPSGCGKFVIEVNNNGHKLYRVCVHCFKNKAEAQQQAGYWGNGTWVYASRGQAKIVYIEKGTIPSQYRPT